MPIAISLYFLAVGTVAAESPSPHDLVIAAIRTLESRDSISAKLHYGVNLFEQRLDGSGVYFEQRPSRDHLMRLELRLQLGDQSSSLVTVCDGRYLYQYRNLPNRSPELTRIDVVQAIRSLERARIAVDAARPVVLPGLGGLPRVLRGLDEHFDFTQPAQRGQRAGLKAVLWRLEGRWKPQDLARLLPDQTAAIQAGRPDLTQLPDYVPDRVALYLGEADWFPYLIEFNREGKVQPLVFVVFDEVAINERIDPAQFVYSPPHDAPFSDKTDSFVEKLKARDKSSSRSP